MTDNNATALVVTYNNATVLYNNAKLIYQHNNSLSQSMADTFDQN